MNHQHILKQAWQILWNYRLLWLLGFVLALTTCSWQGASNLGERYDNGQRITVHSEHGTLFMPGFEATVDLTPAKGPQITLPYSDGQPLVITRDDEWSVDLPPQMERDLEEITEWLASGLPPEVAKTIFGSVVIVAVVIVAIFLLASAARYMADAALIRAVNEQAKTGQKASMGGLLSMGFSRAAWRFFLIDLVIRLPLLLLFLVFVFLSLTPLSLWATGDVTAGLLGMSAAGFLITGVMLLGVAINAAVGVLIGFMRRACALEEMGVLAAIGRGFSLLYHNIKDVVIMAGAAIIVTIAWAVLLIPAGLILIPVILACVIVGGLAAVATLALVAVPASLVLGEVLGIVLAGSVALAIFVPIVGAPIFFLSGLLHVYVSSLWTLTYRELRAAERVAPTPAPKVALTGT